MRFVFPIRLRHGRLAFLTQLQRGRLAFLTELQRRRHPDRSRSSGEGRDLARIPEDQQSLSEYDFGNVRKPFAGRRNNLQWRCYAKVRSQAEIRNG
jgi:hypothetical protein